MTWQVTIGEAEAEQLKLKAQRRAEEKAGFHGVEMEVAV
jgi:hypothetical protein